MIIEEPKETETGLNTTIKVNGKKYIATFNKNSGIKYGDIVKISGEIRSISNYKNQGNSSYLVLFKKKNIHGKIKVQKYYKIGHSNNFYSIFIKIRKILKNKYEKLYPQKVSSFLEALVLGNKENLDSSITQTIQENGLSHMMAISGMHIGIIILLLKKIINLILKDNRINKIIIIVFLIIFNLIIGFISSAMRATVMAILVIICSLLHRKSNVWTNLSISSLIILITNPYNLIDSSFLLSFASTVGIIHLYPKLKKIQIKNKILKYFYEIFLISVSVNIFIFPLTIYYFKKISISFFITRLSVISNYFYNRTIRVM